LKTVSRNFINGKNLYLLIAVFVVLMVILVWIGFKMIMDIRRRNKRRKIRRQEWIARINARKDDA
jgi:uncharacterized membrane protein